MGFKIPQIPSPCPSILKNVKYINVLILFVVSYLLPKVLCVCFVRFEVSTSNLCELHVQPGQTH